MIRKLKVRIVILVVLGLTVSSVGLVFAIHHMNLQTISDQMKSVLSILMVNDGKRPVSWVQAGAVNPQEDPSAVPPEKPENMAGMAPAAPDGTPPPKPEGAPPPVPDVPAVLASVPALATVYMPPFPPPA